MPPALQPFDARPLLKLVDRAAAPARRSGGEWHWELAPDDTPERCRFVFLTCPPLDDRTTRIRRFTEAVGDLSLSGCDERSCQIIGGLPPKLNCFEDGQRRGELHYDITEDDLPFYIRRLDPKRDNSYGILGGRRVGDFVQCYAKPGRRFVVEWAHNRWVRPTQHWDQWKARDRKRLAALGGQHGDADLPSRRDPDLITYADTLRIFQAFMRGEPRPACYPWHNINHLLG